MALVPINVGLIVNDGTGDDLRTAFLKINQNFEEIELAGGQANTISNIGTGIGLFKEKIGVDLRLKSIKAGSGISVTNNPTELLIDNTRNVIVKVNADTGSLTASSVSQEISIVGSTGITTSISGSTLTITGTNYDIETDPTPKLGGNLDLNGFNITGGVGTSVTAQVFSGTLVGNVSGNVFGNVTGNLTGLVNGLDIVDLRNQFLIFDFGILPDINGFREFTNPIQLLLADIIIDMGTILNPSDTGIDGGDFV